MMSSVKLFFEAYERDVFDLTGACSWPDLAECFIFYAFVAFFVSFTLFLPFVFFILLVLLPSLQF